MRIIFFGSSDYCLPIVETLKNKFELVAIITKKDQTVEKFAQSHNINTFTPANKEELLKLKNEISTLKPDLAIVADYGMIIPEEIFSIPVHRTLNIHFSILPKFRGPAPVQYSILFGEEKAGISIIIMDKDLDTGDILWQKEISTFNSQHLTVNNETTGSLYQKLFNIAASELPDVISKYVKNELKPQKQDNSLATYTKHLTRQDGFIPWEILKCAIDNSKPSIKAFNSWPIIKIIPKLEITHALRAFTPWPGLWTEVIINKSKKRLKILQAHLEDAKLVLDLVQLEGKKTVSWKQFVEGYKDFSF